MNVELKPTVGLGCNSGMGSSCPKSKSVSIVFGVGFEGVGFLGDIKVVFGFALTFTILVTEPLVVSLVTQFTL
jgi:hypothetical protein